MIQASFSNDEQRRYLRQSVLSHWGEAGQRALKESRVLIIGAGGLGCPASMYLAAAGVGTLGLIDPDRVDLSNLPRQILFETADVNRRKAEAARDRLLEMNPQITIHGAAEAINAGNADTWIEPYDLVLDGSDNFMTRFAVSASCQRLQKPLVSGTVQGWEGSISSFLPYRGMSYPCYRCFMPGEPEQATSCEQSGVIGTAAGIIGSLMAQEAIKIVMKMESLSGRIVHYDALTTQFRHLKLEKNPACPQCGNPKSARQGCA